MRAEEYQHVVIEFGVIGKLVGYSAIHHCTGVVYLGIVQHLGVFAVADIGYGEDIVLVFVLGYKWHQVGEFAGLGGEDLAFAEYNVLLQIQCYGLGGAEVFHSVRHNEAHFFA